MSYRDHTKENRAAADSSGAADSTAATAEQRPAYRDPLPAPPRSAEVGVPAPPPGSLEAYLARVAELIPAWSRRRRIRALQEMLVDAKRIIIFAIDEMERERSGVRLSEKARR
ncbi:MAG: hypothetical protein FD180_3483 [Planctomycetota bacterium]|nr:MAG: hypothetical protein FD180_3483 [Planctomycetota bacterium]